MGPFSRNERVVAAIVNTKKGPMWAARSESRPAAVAVASTTLVGGAGGVVVEVDAIDTDGLHGVAVALGKQVKAPAGVKPSPRGSVAPSMPFRATLINGDLYAEAMSDTPAEPLPPPISAPPRATASTATLAAGESVSPSTPPRAPRSRRGKKAT